MRNKKKSYFYEILSKNLDNGKDFFSFLMLLMIAHISYNQALFSKYATGFIYYLEVKPFILMFGLYFIINSITVTLLLLLIIFIYTICEYLKPIFTNVYWIMRMRASRC